MTAISQFRKNSALIPKALNGALRKLKPPEPIDFFACRPYQFILSARSANAVVLGEPDFDVVDLKLPGQANIVDNQSTFRGIKSPLCKETWRDQ